jgi:hypothetical protein
MATNILVFTVYAMFFLKIYFEMPYNNPIICTDAVTKEI